VSALRMLQQLLGRGGTVTGMAGVFGLKAAITVLNFALVTLAARSLGADTFGTYSLLFSAAGLLGIMATFGQQVLVMRFWSEYLASGRGDLLKGSLIFSGVVCLAGCALLGVPFLLWCAGTYDTGVAIAAASYLVSLSVVMTTAHLIRTAVGVATGDGYANVLLASPGAVYLGLCLSMGWTAELFVLFAVMAAGAVMAVMIHLRALYHALLIAFPDIARVRPAFHVSVWANSSIRLWASNSLEAANQYLDVLIVGYLMDPVTAGAYFVLTRVANVISVASDAIHMFCTRHIPELYFRKQFLQLNAILDTVAWMTLIVIVGSVAAIAVGGHWLLAIFNNAYVGYHGALIVLSIGAASLAAAGPSSSILMLTGHESRYLAIIAATVLLRVVGFVMLVPLFGISGAVAAVTVSLLLVTILLRRAVRERTGIDGSILRLIARQEPPTPIPAPQAQS
jgi:O-antigen/teichoic acid export membrane protein